MTKPTRCPTCKRRVKRSTEANRRYWALLHVVADKLRPGGDAYSAEQWHLYFRSRFLGAVDHKLPGGRSMTIPLSTADLDVGEFNEYMVQVEAFANERDCYLQDEVFA